MDIGKPVRTHNIPEPRPIRRWEEEERRRNVSRPRITKTTSPDNPYFSPDKNDTPIPVPNWPAPKKVEVESE